MILILCTQTGKEERGYKTQTKGWTTATIAQAISCTEIPKRRIRLLTNNPKVIPNMIKLTNKIGICKPKEAKILNLYNTIDPIVKLITVINIFIMPIITRAVKYSAFVKGDAKRFKIFYSTSRL